MKGRILLANLAILNLMKKTVYCSGMWIERYGQTASTVKIEDPTVQDSSLSKQKIK